MRLPIRPKIKPPCPRHVAAARNRGRNGPVRISAGRPTIFREVPHLRSLLLAARKISSWPGLK